MYAISRSHHCHITTVTMHRRQWQKEPSLGPPLHQCCPLTNWIQSRHGSILSAIFIHPIQYGEMIWSWLRRCCWCVTGFMHHTQFCFLCICCFPYINGSLQITTQFQCWICFTTHDSQYGFSREDGWWWSQEPIPAIPFCEVLQLQEITLMPLGGDTVCCLQDFPFVLKFQGFCERLSSWLQFISDWIPQMEDLCVHHLVGIASLLGLCDTSYYQHRNQQSAKVWDQIKEAHPTSCPDDKDLLFVCIKKSSKEVLDKPPSNRKVENIMCKLGQMMISD